MPWGINLGDGVNRHPAPLYEALWALVALLIIPTLARRLSWPSGSQFRIFLPPYCLWRLYSETLKPASPITHWGLSAISWAALITLIIYLPLSIRWWKHNVKIHREFMHRKTRPYLFYSTTSGLCGQCAQRVEAKIIIKQQNVYMDKWCPQHGTERVLISTDADYYRRCREVFIKPPELPQQFNTPMRYGCPGTVASAQTTCSTAV